jgi:RND superfamily putative drug exporter
VLAFAAAFGLMGLLIPVLFGGTDVVYYVPLVAAVLLIGLGSDYNVFIAGRIREEAARRRLSEAIAVGAPAASRAITVAGITLASTFALLAIVPLRPFQELALLLALGVLVDALLVRPLLIPALIAVGGRFSWWPGNPVKPGKESEFVAEVARRSGRPPGAARALTLATLATLGERIPGREADHLAVQLPEALRPALDAGESEPFSADEFRRRVAERANDPDADPRPVLAVLVDLLPATEMDYVRAALSEDYRPLLGDEPVRHRVASG